MFKIQRQISTEIILLGERKVNVFAQDNGQKQRIEKREWRIGGR